MIADAHYSPHRRPELVSFFQAMVSGRIEVVQLLLMGDIFDALFGYIPHTCEQNKEAVALLHTISKKTEVIYLEGNHDFNLHTFFPHIQIFPIDMQPVACSFYNTQVLLAHGDFDGDFGYRVYTKIIRNPFVLRILRVIDTLAQHAILHKIDTYLGKKNDCNSFEGFEDFIAKRIIKLNNCTTFIEGHYHQNKLFDVNGIRYINLAAFACNQRYFRVKSSKDNKLLLEEKQFTVGDEEHG